MKHIVIDARELRTSTGRYIERLLHYLQQSDKENIYSVLLKSKDIKGWQTTNPNFKKVVCDYKEFTFGEQLGMAKQLYGLKADLVHFGMTQQPLLYLKRSITTVHDLTTARFDNPDKNMLVYKVKQQVYKVVIWYAAHKSKQVIVPTNYVAKDLADYTNIKSSKIKVTYESADKIADSPAPLKYLQNADFIMYVGRPTPHKNLDRLVEAFKLLQSDHPTLKLVLAGKLDTNYKRLQAKTKDNQNIVFTDFVSDAELRWLYENAKAYVFPSLSEGFGLPGLEAMQYGTPLASSNATCLPEVYGDAAVYFDPLNPKAIAKTIDKLLTDKKLRQTIVEREAKQLSKYSWAKMAEQTLKIYRDVL